MKKFYISLLFLVTSVNLFPQVNWVFQNSGTTQTLFSIFFSDSTTGWTVGNSGIVLKTTNSGTNWITQYNSGYSFLYSVNFINSQTGWAVGYKSGLGRVIKTTNSGTNWFELTNNSLGVVLTNVQFIDNNTGWASGNGGYNTEATIIKTTNGGVNWIFQYDTTGINTYYLNSIYFANASTGWAVGWYNRILKTTDGGVSWFFQSSPIYGMYNTVNFINSNTGFIGGSDILKTTNGGSSWQQYGVDYSLFSIKMIDQNIIYGVGSSGKIVKTTNGGINWAVLSSNTTESLYSVFFVNQYTGWCTGSNGVILKTTNGGITLTKEIKTMIPKNNCLYQNYPNPFNPYTIIKYDIKVLSDVRITVYDIKGNELETLVNEKHNPGTYEVPFDGTKYSSGVYHYKIVINNSSETKKMILLK